MRTIRSQTTALAFVLFAIALSTKAQTPDWEKLRPEGEEFTVMIPKGSSFETAKEPYHKMEINKRLYLSQTPNGPVYAVVSLSGIKSNPAMYSEFQRMNSYVDAFKHLFVPAIRKGAVSKLTLVGETNLQGNKGREYRMTVADLSGTVRTFATRKRFYAIAYLNTKKDEAIEEEFLSSFVLPEKLAEPPPTVAEAAAAALPTPPPNQPAAQGQPASTESSGTPANTAEAQPAGTTEPKLEEPDASSTQPKKRRPITGGVLNGKAITLPKPDYPAEAREAKAAGQVVVQVTIDESGIVTEAKAVSGHPLLVQAAVNAALQARFSPTLLMGEPVKVSGMIVYNFVRQ